MSTITIRPYNPSDTPVLVQLFRDAVHAINIQHYSAEQVAAWAPQEMDLDKWQKSLSENITFVAVSAEASGEGRAEIEGKIVGFADMTKNGYLDRLYVHKDFQGRWISLLLFRAIEKAARELGLAKITTDCSITAKVPAERMGFKVVKEQVVEKRGQTFINYAMEKLLH